MQDCWCYGFAPSSLALQAHERRDETVSSPFNSFFLSTTACWPLTVLPLNTQIPTISTGALLNDTKNEREEQEDWSVDQESQTAASDLI